MGTNVVHYKDADGDTSAGPSMNIWADCPVLGIMEDPGLGYYFFDDFIGCPELAAGSAITQLPPYVAIADTNGGGIAAATDVVGGAIALSSGTTADCDTTLQLGGGNSFVISDTAGSDKKLWFEARIKISAITDDAVQYFIGLAEEDRCVDAGVFGKSGGTTPEAAMADIDYIGFLRYDGGTTAINFVYNLSGQTGVEKIAAIDTAGADTFMKLGFLYDPDAETAQRIKVYADGEESTTYVTGTNIATATGSAFPDGEELTLTMATMSDSTTSGTMTVDWWRCAQLR
ncbi:MAG: hypothetical protein ACYTBZ_31205 [Planctomycetota bacterium]|jgi:hypothetical protein